MPGWKAARVESIHVDRQNHTIYVYEMSDRKPSK